MMQNTNLDQTLQENQVFEKELFKNDIKVKKCRADNGHFTELGFKNKV